MSEMVPSLPVSTEAASTAFFVVSGTLPLESQSYVPRQADRDLLAALLAGEYCFVLNSRQMGKSSLSVRTMAKLQEAGVQTVFLDLTKLGGSNVTPEQWYIGLLSETGRALGLRKEFLNYWKENAEYSPVQRFFGALHDVAVARLDRRIVLFVDEVDAVKSLSFNSDEFFAAVRECYNRRVQEPVYGRLACALVGSATASDLIQDTRTSPFNIGKRIELKDFTREEVLPLAGGIARPNAASLVERAFTWTNGHPFLTQALCAEIAQDASIQTSADVDSLVGRMFFEAKARERNVNLADVANRVLRSYLDPEQKEEHRAAILDLYRQVWSRRRRVTDDETNRLVAVLHLSGITRSVNGELLVRNRIYERVFDRTWIEQNMPDAELRRQRQAYRSGMLRSSAIAAVVVLIMAVLSGWALTSAHHASLRESEAKVAKDKAKGEAERAEKAERKLSSDAITLQKALDAAKSAQKHAHDQETNAKNQAAIAQTQKQRANAKAAALLIAGNENNLQRYISKMGIVQREWEYDNLPQMRRLLQETERSSDRGMEWDYWKRQCRGAQRTIRVPGQTLSVWRYTRDGRWLLAHGRPRTKSAGTSALRTYVFDAHTVKEWWHYDSADSVSDSYMRDQRDEIAANRYVLLKGGATLTLIDIQERKRVWQRNFPPSPFAVRSYTALLADDRRFVLMQRDPTTGCISVTFHDLVTQAALPGGYTEPVRSAGAICSPNGRYLWRNIGNEMQVVETATGKTLWTKPYAFCLGFSPDGERMLRSSINIFSPVNGNVKTPFSLLETATGKEAPPFPEGTTYAEFTPDTSFVIDGGPAKGFHLRRSNTGEEIWSGDRIPHVTSDDRYYLFEQDNLIHVYETAFQQEILTLRNSHKMYDNTYDNHVYIGNSLYFAASADASQIALKQDDGSLAIWDTAFPIEQPLISGDLTSSPKLSADGKTLLGTNSPNSGSTNKLRRWDTRNGQALLTLHGDAEYATALLTADAGRVILYNNKRDVPGCFVAVVTDTTTLKPVCRFEVDEHWRGKRREDPNRPPDPDWNLRWKRGGTLCACLTADGSQYLHVSSDNTIERIDVLSGQRLTPFNCPAEPLSLSCSPNSATLMVMGNAKNNDGSLLALDMHTGKEKRTFPFPATTITVVNGLKGVRSNPLSLASLQFSRDGRFACLSLLVRNGVNPTSGALATPVPTLLLDLRTGKEALPLHDCLSVVFFSDNQRVATADSLGRIEIWNLATGKRLQVLEDNTGRRIIDLQVTADGTRLFCSYARETRLWSVATGKLLQVLSDVTQVHGFADGSVLLQGEMFPHTHKPNSVGIVTRNDAWWMRAPHAVETAVPAEIGPASRYSRQGRAAAEAGQWQRAHDAFATAVRLQSDDPNDYSGLAVTQLLLGERAGYGQTCERMAAQWELRMTPECCLAANGLRSYAALIAGAKEALQNSPQDNPNKLNLGDLQFRAGQWQECVNTLTPLLAPEAVATTVPDVEDWVFAAMAYWHLGKKEEAKRYLKSGEECLARKKPPIAWDDRAAYDIWMKEAQALITPR